MGPKAGVNGGQVIAQGSPIEIMQSSTATGLYLSGHGDFQAKSTRRSGKGFIQVQNATLNNLKNITVSFPTGTLTCITGVSGSGKSSLVEVLVSSYRDAIVVDQSPPGTTPRSTPATYIKILDAIRLEYSKATGQSPSLFTFNSKGACPECNGLGYKLIDMHFLGDVLQMCEECKGKRFCHEALIYHYRGRNIADVFDMTVMEAESFFDNDAIKSQLHLLVAVGLDYLRLGQPLDTLSGGEAQRIKLASRLGQRGSVYILDEPSRGLHFADIQQLLVVLNKIVDNDNTVIVIEHNLDIIHRADWIIDLGPEGGEKGGEIVAQGTPETVAVNLSSYTGRYLRQYLCNHTKKFN
jgi:excinuclease UvrABC ATPase subunit